MQSVTARLALASFIGIAALLVPSTAGAIIPGPNGPLVFTSGRDDPPEIPNGSGTDGRAQIWFLSGPGGSATRLTTLELSHHRHASWSPDRTKIAYARGPDDGTPFDGPWDIFVQDLSNPGSPPVNITQNTDADLNEDRPSWSPDGTRLAYAEQVGTTSWNVVTQLADGSGTGATETTVAVDASIGAGASGQFSRPQWGPDQSVIYYGRTHQTGTYDIYRAPSNGSNVIGTLIVGNADSNNPTNDYQPSLSPDGTKLCFTRQGGDKDVYVKSTSSAATDPGTALLTAGGTDEYECAWSPDGSKIAFVRGAFGNGEILMRNSNATGAVDPVTNVAGRFDGNPEWTRDPSPSCSDTTANVAVNGFVRIPLSCIDAPDPPSFAAKSPLDPNIVSPPTRGVIGAVQNDNSVIYTPNKDFSGTDTFTFRANDGTSDSPLATATVNVSRTQAGGVATPGGGRDTTASSITGVDVVPGTWRRGSALPSFNSAARVGTTIRFNLSEAATVTLTFQRRRAGRRVGRRCVAPRRNNRKRRKCKRYVTAGRLVFNGKPGANRVKFAGRLTRRKRLALGRYRLRVDARDAAGNRSKPRTDTFRIVRR